MNEAAAHGRPHLGGPASVRALRLKITEIFFSLQGETSRVGLPTVFVRLTGCPLRCGYCDTAYAFTGGEWMSVDAILDTVAGYGVKRVTVTGGEPLAQPACLKFLSMLCESGFSVSLETSGAMDVSRVDTRVIKVLDIKTPGSGESHRNLENNLGYLNEGDEIKFVLCDRTDYEWAKAQISAHKLDQRCALLFSPSHGQLAERDLADWILADRLPVRFQHQLHKHLWGNVAGR